jgi:hypothetical protein
MIGRMFTCCTTLCPPSTENPVKGQQVLSEHAHGHLRQQRDQQLDRNAGKPGNGQLKE